MKITNATQYNTQDLENLVLLCWNNRKAKRVIQLPSEVVFVYANAKTAIGMLGSGRRLKMSSVFLVRLRHPFKLNIPELEQLSLAAESASVPEKAVVPLAAMLATYFSQGWTYSAKHAIGSWVANDSFPLPAVRVEPRPVKGAAKIGSLGVARARLCDLQTDELYTARKLAEWQHRLNAVTAKRIKVEAKCQG